MILYIIRHGETDWNVRRLLQGRSNAQLNESGIFLAGVTGKALQDVPFSVCFSSPLDRAVDTAEIILKGRHVPIITDPLLYEMDFGVLEGKSLHPDHPEIERPACLYMHRDPFVYIPPEGGESLQEVIGRSSRFLKQLLDEPAYQDKTILISSHGLASRALLYAASGSGGEFWHGRVPPNCSASILESAGGSFTLKEIDRIWYGEEYLQDYYKEPEQHEDK